MRIAGVDPGTINAGVAILDVEAGKAKLAFSGTIRAGRKKKVSERLLIVFDELKTVFQEWQPDIMAVENVFYHKNFRAAIAVGEARAAAMIAARASGVSVTEYPPARVKESICGNGVAKKDQVQYMVRNLLKIKGSMSPDSADAVAVAYCHFNMMQFKETKAELKNVPVS